MLRFIAVALGALVGCSPNPCGNSRDTNPVALDISGASNTDCTLVVTDGAGVLSYDIPAPSPAIANTSLDQRPPPNACDSLPDGGFTFDGGARTSTELCFQGDDALNALAHAKNVGMCPLTLTLTCGATVLYDHATWHFCYENC
jgi:hypothetical protein